MAMSIYLDHAATTPVRREVLDAMLPFFSKRFGNPSSAHSFGRAARAALEDARDRIAATLGAQRSEIFFTSGGTEADNLAVFGRGRALPGRAVACSAVEHKAVLSAVSHLSRSGQPAILIAVDENGCLDLAALDEALKQRPAVVSVMWVNNEVGTVQAIRDIAQRCAEHDVAFHTDAVQAWGRVPVRPMDGISLLSVSGHKLGAPKGIGVLYKKEGVELVASQHGGSQERGVRPGTQNVAAAVGMAVAMQLTEKERIMESERLAFMRNQLQWDITSSLPDIVVNGGEAARVPHILNVSVPDVDQDSLLVALDLEGIAVSTASACQSGTGEPSHVLVAMGQNMEDAAVMRMSIGYTTTDEEIAKASRMIPAIIRKVRKSGGMAQWQRL